MSHGKARPGGMHPLKGNEYDLETLCDGSALRKLEAGPEPPASDKADLVERPHHGFWKRAYCAVTTFLNNSINLIHGSIRTSATTREISVE